MVEPEIYDFLDWIVGVADSLGLVAAARGPRRVRDPRAPRARTGTGPTTSCFPACSSTRSQTGRRRGWPAPRTDRRSGSSRCSTATTASRSARTSTGILEPREMLRPGRPRPAPRRQRQPDPVRRPRRRDVDVHQLNCTYYSALDCDDDRYVAARAIQLFARGVPQIYYVGLLAGENDHAAVAESGEGRAINRHDYSTGRSTAAWSDRWSSGSSTWSGCGAPIRPLAERSTSPARARRAFE